jgi:hypothetical protein
MFCVRIRRERPYDDLVGRFAGLVALALTACRVLDDGHCANADGDATCSARGAGLDHCDRCVAKNDGCVAEPPSAPECAVDGTDTSTAAPSSDGTTAPIDDADVDSSTTTTSSTETTSDPTIASESSETSETSESSGVSSESTSGDGSSSTTQGEPPCLGPTSPCEADAECCSETCTGLGLCL